MSSQFMHNVANLLEKVAAYIDQEENVRTQAIQTERKKIAQALNEKIATATGEELNPELLEKIAAADPNIIDTVIKLAERTNAQPPDTVGEPSNLDDNNTYNNKNMRVKEAAAQADNQFLNWIMSS